MSKLLLGDYHFDYYYIYIFFVTDRRISFQWKKLWTHRQDTDNINNITLYFPADEVHRK